MRLEQLKLYVPDGSMTSSVNADQGVYWGNTVVLPFGAKFVCVSHAEIRATWTETELGGWEPFTLDNYTPDNLAVYFRFQEAPVESLVTGSFIVTYMI